MLKKGAMFGLCRALKKESGRLFLASRQSVGSQETRDSFKTNRGAMFGLDARIALAIFGALSVISGAALYSAAQEAKLVAQITELEELGKAFDAYHLDIGSILSRSSTDSSSSWYYRLRSSELKNPEYSGGFDIPYWNGPYVTNYEFSGNYLIHPKYKTDTIFLTYKDSSWFDPWGNSSVWCESGPDCYIWINFRGIDTDLLALLDERIDGLDGNANGSFRYDKVNSTLGYDIFYKYRHIGK